MIEKGDRIKFSGEGVVEGISGVYVDVRMDNGIRTSLYLNAVEYERMYTTFKPGDVVEWISDPTYRYTLAREGFISHKLGTHIKYGGAIDSSESEFTSDRYRKVDL